MSAITAAHAIRRGNPPLAYHPQAIINHLCHQATNGPAYIQHSATKALARMKGLFEIGRLSGRHTYEVALATAERLTATVVEKADQATGKVKTGYARIAELQNGAEVTDEDLGGFARLFKKDTNEEDEEGSNQDDDEPP